MKKQVDSISLAMSCHGLQIHYISATRRCRIFQLTPTLENKLWKVSTLVYFFDRTSALCTSFCTLQNARACYRTPELFVVIAPLYINESETEYHVYRPIAVTGNV